MGLVLGLFNLLYGQSETNDIGSVCVSDHGVKEPNKHAVLELSTTTGESEKIDRGLLIPRMTYDEMLAINHPVNPLVAEDDIDENDLNVKDGTLVYVTTENLFGFYYWDKTLQKWVQLATTDDKQVVEPIGTIIMYTNCEKIKELFYTQSEVEEANSNSEFELFVEAGMGKLDTEMEGWALCNGKNGTPDMSGMFVAGANSRDFVNQSEGKNIYESTDYDIGQSHKASEGNWHTIKLNASNWAHHTHSLNSSISIKFDHKHPLTEVSHSHFFPANSGYFNYYSKKIGGQVSLLNTFSILIGGNSIRYSAVTRLKKAEELIVSPTIKIREVDYNNPENKKFKMDLPGNAVGPYGSNEDVDEIDVRPDFYTVVYLIKVFNRVSDYKNYNDKEAQSTPEIESSSTQEFMFK